MPTDRDTHAGAHAPQSHEVTVKIAAALLMNGHIIAGRNLQGVEHPRRLFDHQMVIRRQACVRAEMVDYAGAHRKVRGEPAVDDIPVKVIDPLLFEYP